MITGAGADGNARAMGAAAEAAGKYGLLLAGALLPNSTNYLTEEPGIPRTWRDDVTGALEEAYNTALDTASMSPLGKFVGLIPRAEISPAQTRGAAIIEAGTILASLRTGLAAAICCFAAGTPVYTEHGLRPIEEIEAGDLVWARDETTGEIALKPVEKLLHRHDRVIWLATFEVERRDGTFTSELFEVTDDHSWANLDGRWLWTKELQPGMKIRRADGTPAHVVSVVQTNRVASTYNLEVADFHSYFVGEAKILVHNGLCNLAARIAAKWTLGAGKSATKWANQMAKRGWNEKQIGEALGAKGIPARNAVNPGNPATRHVHPTTGQSVVIDNKTNEIIHVGGKAFDYSDWDL